MNWPKSGRSNISTFYGDPDPSRRGESSRVWEDANLFYIQVPWKMVLAWDTSQSVTRIKVHKKCAESLGRILDEIWQHFGSQAAIEAARLHLFGGTHNFRAMRGGQALSTHSWACAIDLDPSMNGFGKTYRPGTGMMDLDVVRIFQKHGWAWGGQWPTADAMHFQAVQSGSGQDLSAIEGAGASEALVRQVQQALIAKGYHEVGDVDGDYGTKTHGAILAFEATNELPLAGRVTSILWEQIINSAPRQISEARADGTPYNSRIVDNSNVGIGTATTVAVGTAVTQITPVIEQIEQGSSLLTRLQQATGPLLPFLGSVWPLLLIGGCGALIFFFWRSKQARIEDYQTGKTAR